MLGNPLALAFITRSICYGTIYQSVNTHSRSPNLMTISCTVYWYLRNSCLTGLKAIEVRLQAPRFYEPPWYIPLPLPTFPSPPTCESPEFVSEILKQFRLAKDMEVYVTFVSASIARRIEKVTQASASKTCFDCYFLVSDKSGASFERSDSQSSVDRSQEDSDGREYESDSSKSRRQGNSSSHTGKSNEDSGSEARKSGRRSVARLGTSVSQEEPDGRTSDSDSERSSRLRLASSSPEGDTEKLNCTVLELNSATKTGVRKDSTDSAKGSRPSLQRPRKLSRSKLLSKIESSPLSHSWTPGAIEKIVKSWREAKSPEAQDKTKEDDSNLKHVSHVQFL